MADVKPPKTLKWDEKHKTEYAIPEWQKELQIQAAIALPIPRVKASHEKNPEPCAVVAFGPSLAQTWEQIRPFKYIITCSGAHKFLVERGIIPTYDIEVDPRPHKAKLIGEPHKDVTYLLASTCHPKLFEYLKDYKVELWHVFDNKADAIRVLPADEWALTGGASVGLRALTMARFFGFTNLHVFGMDGSFGETGSHAAEHPNAPPRYAVTEYDGKEYRTTISMLEVAKQTWHELDMMPDVKATFYGDGLVQAMAKNYVPKPVPEDRALIGFSKPATISAEYKRLNTELHRTNVAYGVGGHRHVDTVVKIAKTLGTKNVLDYGAGKSTLARAMPYHIDEYDPAIPGKDESPKPADLVTCLDVLEHVEPDRIDYTLEDIRRCTIKLCFATICTQPSSKFLADGRNAHVLLKDKEWWEQKLSCYFKVEKMIERSPLLYVILTPKSRPSYFTKVIQPVQLNA